MARHYRTRLHFLTGQLDPEWKPDPRSGGDRHKPRGKNGFVSWDGESITDERGHSYVMLISSAGDSIVNPDGLSTIECLETLLSGGSKSSRKHHVGFAFSYDVNMILRDVPTKNLKQLWTFGKTRWKGYRIHYKSRKEFAIYHGERSFRIWDTWGFFQSSFVDALKAYGHKDFLAFIAEMKEKRASFTRDDLEEMQRYCEMEVAKHQEIMEQFGQYLEECDLKLSRFDGAGSVASAFLRKHKVKSFKRESTPELQKAAAHAYFGGRIELVRYGHDKKATIYQYDIRSAYPAEIQNLPCLACGEWRHIKGNALGDSPFTVYRLTWDFDSGATVCPFPWRDTHGAIFFPTSGAGYYWKPEVTAAQEAVKAGVVSGEIIIKERWEYISNCDHKPFAWVPEMYSQRAAWKAAGVGAEKVLKLGLNSLYGKAAQRVGHADGKPPVWHQLEWAGYVTSATRAKLYRAAFPVILSDDLIAFATDAVFATAPLPDLPCSAELGDWDADEHRGGTFVQSGVYWLGEGSERVGHTRGFARDDLKPQAILAAWRAGQIEITWSIRRFISLGRALTSDKQFRKWRQWVDEPKKLSLTPIGTKRKLNSGARPKPHRGFVLTYPTDPHSRGITLSAPIKLPWLPLPHAFDADAARLDYRIDDEQDSAYD